MQHAAHRLMSRCWQCVAAILVAGGLLLFAGAIPAVAQAPAADPPALPDLTIVTIRRTPRYPAYKVDYPAGIPTLRPGTEGDQRFPMPGEAITLTAQVKNQGRSVAPAVRYAWKLDGASFGAGATPVLLPGASVELSISWRWQPERHEFSIELDPAGSITEICKANNRLTHTTDALYLAIHVHPYVYAAFARRANMVGSWSFEDWIQRQVAQLNERLAGAVYPLTPAGVSDRVRIDQIEVLALAAMPRRETDTPLYAPLENIGPPPLIGAGALSPYRSYEDRLVPARASGEAPLFDGEWGFYVAEDDDHTPENESIQSAENYAAEYAGRIDWGLVHELTHQLGMIDLYHLNLEGASADPLLGADGRRLLIGISWPNPDLMGGGDIAPYDDGTVYSPNTARALVSNVGQRRGYYGEYLYDLPAQIDLRVLNNRGAPAAGAQVDIFQTTGGALGTTPVISGTVDAGGILHLPNRSFAAAGLTTATGHTLSPNPFGQVDVVGMNSLLLARIRTPDWPPHEEYRWTRLTDLNLARWAGQSDVYTITWATGYPPADAPAPPTLFGDVAGAQVSLRWLPPTPPAASYRVYRAEAPAFSFARRADVGNQTRYTDTLDVTSWYAVTAVDSAGRESRFSAIFRAPRLVSPVAIVVEPATRQEIILDAHYGGLFYRQSDDAWIGRLNSEHLGLVGANALSAGPRGLVALAQGRRLALLTLERRFVSNFFIGSDRVNPDANAAYALMFGPAPTRTQAPADDGAALFLTRFDGDLFSHGQAPAQAEQVSFAVGRFGSAASLMPESRLAYSQTAGGPPLWQTEAGAVEFWLRPHWPAQDGRDHVLLDIGDGTTYRLVMVKDAGGGLWAWMSDYGRHGAFVGTDARDWQAGEWRHLALTWNAARFDLTMDGILRETNQWKHPITGTVEALWIGSERGGGNAADADFDELRISSLARWDITDVSRLIVSDRGQQLLSIYDLLGNPVSTFGSAGSAAGQFQQPAGLAWLDSRQQNALLVADQDGGRLQVLDFDGQHLSNPRIVAAGLGQPTALAVGPDGDWLVSDMSRDVIYRLRPTGAIIQTWTGPDDGHAGGFADPRGLTLRADGLLLIADTGNSRVVALRGVYPRQSLLPLVMH